MPAEFSQHNSDSHSLEAVPNAGQLDVLGVLWAEQQNENRPLQLSEVYRRVCERRHKLGEPEPALTTVSTQLRGLVRKKLIEEMGVNRTPTTGNLPLRTRGGFRPPTRSPNTSYRAAYRPGEVLHSTFCGLAEAYPSQVRLDALIDFAQALEIPNDVMSRLIEFVEHEKTKYKHSTELERNPDNQD